MKTIPTLTLAVAALLLAGTSQGQTTPTTTGSGVTSIRDNPGLLGHSYSDLHYSWADFHRDSGLDADGFIAGLSGNAPIARGIDLGLGYSYYRENNHRNPFTGTPYDTRYHQLATQATFYSPMAGMKPFVTGGIGYQWSRGDLQSLRIDDHRWLWSVTGGAEIPLGRFVLTPHIGYSDTMHRGSNAARHYGAEAHHWFNEKTGAYLDGTFHDPRGGSGPEWWTYTAGVRFRF